MTKPLGLEIPEIPPVSCFGRSSISRAYTAPVRSRLVRGTIWLEENSVSLTAFGGGKDGKGACRVRGANAAEGIVAQPNYDRPVG